MRKELIDFEYLLVSIYEGNHRHLWQKLFWVYKHYTSHILKLRFKLHDPKYGQLRASIKQSVMLCVRFLGIQLSMYVMCPYVISVILFLI